MSFIYGLYDRKAFYKVKNCFCYCFFNFLQAYKEWERINGKEQQLPGIPLNVDQLFFVSMGQVRYFKKYNQFICNGLVLLSIAVVMFSLKPEV